MKNRNKLKSLIIVLAITFFPSGHIVAQGMPVYDNTNFLALGQSLIESAKQTSELLKTARFLKEQKERIEKVNAVINQLKAVREIVENNQHLYETVREDLRQIISSPYIRAQEVDRISESFNSLMENALEDLDFMQQLLTNDILNMDDAQRMEVLETQRMRSRQVIREIDLKKQRYETLIEFRRIKDLINQRQTQY
ncbi:conjugal transfer protein [Salegentibacter sp. LM13S]|uniref:conjugal transfer protein n=1 Tax=Salegentibacter lacus TaxID=2873599 RepID=UPI001CCE6590|nr:conjugal transfer protein [Salegentibacter lacus]MBZ9629772.1 conjugal transfer protein [Salegentibacter lacus]